MTNEEAIKELLADRALYGSDIVSAGDGTPEGDLMLALDIAVAAVGKQIPQKTLKRPFDYSNSKGKAYYENYDNFLCPSCGKRIISNINGGWVAGRRQKYCDKCGQALDWWPPEEKQEEMKK